MFCRTPCVLMYATRCGFCYLGLSSSCALRLKKVVHKVTLITLLIFNGFSNFFHWYILLQKFATRLYNDTYYASRIEALRDVPVIRVSLSSTLNFIASLSGLTLLVHVCWASVSWLSLSAMDTGRDDEPRSAAPVLLDSRRGTRDCQRLSLVWSHDSLKQPTNATFTSTFTTELMHLRSTSRGGFDSWSNAYYWQLKPCDPTWQVTLPSSETCFHEDLYTTFSVLTFSGCCIYFAYMGKKTCADWVQFLAVVITPFKFEMWQLVQEFGGVKVHPFP